jgi:beta-galactosidase
LCAAGGILVVTYASGYVDEHDLCFLGVFPGPLKELLGIWNEEIDALARRRDTQGQLDGRQYEARDFCERITFEGPARSAASTRISMPASRL